MRRVRMFTFCASKSASHASEKAFVTPNAFHAHKIARECMVAGGIYPGWVMGVYVAPYEIISSTYPDVGVVFRLLVERPLDKSFVEAARVEDRDLAHIIERRMKADPDVLLGLRDD